MTRTSIPTTRLCRGVRPRKRILGKIHSIDIIVMCLFTDKFIE